MASPAKHPLLVEWYGGPKDGTTTSVLPRPDGEQPFAWGEVVYTAEGGVVAARFKRRCPLILRPILAPHPLGQTHRLMADWTQGEWVEG